MKKFLTASAIFLGSAACTHVFAQTLEVQDAWARATVPGQNATGVFMKIKPKENGRLVGASSPVAGVVEMHEMKMQGVVMQMNAIEGGLPLSAGKTLELKPGAYHVMLMDLHQVLEKGSTIPLSLHVKNGKGVQKKVDLQVPVLQVAPAPQSVGEYKH